MRVADGNVASVDSRRGRPRAHRRPSRHRAWRRCSGRNRRAAGGCRRSTSARGHRIRALVHAKDHRRLRRTARCRARAPARAGSRRNRVSMSRSICARSSCDDPQAVDERDLLVPRDRPQHRPIRAFRPQLVVEQDRPRAVVARRASPSRGDSARNRAETRASTAPSRRSSRSRCSFRRRPWHRPSGIRRWASDGTATTAAKYFSSASDSLCDVIAFTRSRQRARPASARPCRGTLRHRNRSSRTRRRSTSGWRSSTRRLSSSRPWKEE